MKSPVVKPPIVERRYLGIASLDFRYADKIARDKLLPSDPAFVKRPDSFYDLTGATLSLSYRW